MILIFPTKKTGWLIGILSIYMVYEIFPLHIWVVGILHYIYPLIGGFNPIGKICSSDSHMGMNIKNIFESTS